MRTLIAGGGTGGHLTPALALARELQRADPDGAVLLVVRRGSLDESMTAAVDVPVEALEVRGVDTSHPLRALSALLRLLPATIRVRRLLRRFGADVVVAAGGYVSVPVVLAARWARVPAVLLEQNAVPGRTVRLLARRARVVATSYESTAALLPGAAVEHTGNPVREQFSRDAPAPPARGRPSHVLVMGGSQGARRINDAVASCVRELLENNPSLHLAHQCGAADAGWVLPIRAGLPDAVRDRYTVAAFFDDVDARVRDADIVVMRAGGSSLAEVSALGRPMILVPYPHAGGHQAENAAPYVAAGAAVMVRDEELSAERLRSEVEALLRDTARWHAMAQASVRRGRPRAAQAVAALVRRVARGAEAA